MPTPANALVLVVGAKLWPPGLGEAGAEGLKLPVPGGMPPALLRARGRPRVFGPTQLIFAPGFSTAQSVTDISGRGVGMDVVRRNIEAMGGKIEIESTLGLGSNFRLVLPLMTTSH